MSLELIKLEKKMSKGSVLKSDDKRVKYPFSRMQVGESVFFSGAKTGGKEYSAAISVGRYKGWRFGGKSEEGGLRIWRIE